MPIKFLCPNGHQLTAPDNLSGKPGKCPKCNTPFVVPTPEEDEEPAEEQAAETPSEAPVESQGEEKPAEVKAAAAEISQGSGKGKMNPADLFVFLCPNGHKLNGPPSLKGKAGKCPHCGAKFRIPSDEEELELPEETPEEPVPESSSGDQFVFPGFETDESAEEVYEAVEVEDTVDPPPDGIHPLCYIVGRLWDRKTDDTELEIFLAEGEIISPELYSEVLSIKEFGVFGSKDGDGNYSVTIIPWTTVRKIGIRKLPELSDKVFR
ncbi:MAG: hypothetical protein ACKVP0_28670 [Pirellulaceae bacterium]